MKLTVKLILIAALPILLLFGVGISQLVKTSDDLQSINQIRTNARLLSLTSKIIGLLQHEKLVLDESNSESRDLLNSEIVSVLKKVNDEFSVSDSVLDISNAIIETSKTLSATQSKNQNEKLDKAINYFLSIEGEIARFPMSKGSGKIFSNLVFLETLKTEINQIAFDLKNSRLSHADEIIFHERLLRLLGVLEHFFQTTAWAISSDSQSVLQHSITEFQSSTLTDNKQYHRFSKQYKEHLFNGFHELSKGIEEIIANEIEQSLNRLNSAAAKERQDILIIVIANIVTLMGSIIMAWVIARQITATISKLKDFAESGYDSQKALNLNLNANDELKDLGLAMKAMSDRIHISTMALRDNEQRFKLVADYTHDWEYWMTPTGKFVWVSPASEITTGYKPEAFYQNQRILEDIVFEDDREKLIAHLHESQNEKCSECENFCFRIVDRKGEVKWIKHSCRSIFSDGGVFLGRRSANEEITGQVRATEEKEKLQRQLFHSEKLASLGTLSAGLAHEINGPLTIIKGYNEIVRRRLESDGRFVDLITLIDKQNEATRMIIKIVDGLRTYSRIDGNRVEIVDLHLTIDKTLEICEGILSKSQIKIVKHLESQSPYVIGSMGKLQQVFMNLITNSRDAFESLDRQKMIEISTYDNDLEVIWVFKDNGIGIPFNQQTLIFDPFFTTKPPGKGTGLGLSISASIIENMNGHIELESSEGKGTLFRFSFPRANLKVAENNH